MPEYIDREALVAKFDRMGLGEHSFIEKVFSDGVRTIIAEMPAADVVPVVRCGDCKHSRELDRSDRYEDSFVDGCLWCMVGRGDGVLPDQFCDYGERENKFVK